MREFGTPELRARACYDRASVAAERRPHSMLRSFWGSRRLEGRQARRCRRAFGNKHFAALQRNMAGYSLERSAGAPPSSEWCRQGRTKQLFEAARQLAPDHDLDRRALHPWGCASQENAETLGKLQHLRGSLYDRPIQGSATRSRRATVAMPIGGAVADAAGKQRSSPSTGRRRHGSPGRDRASLNASPTCSKSSLSWAKVGASCSALAARRPWRRSSRPLGDLVRCFIVLSPKTQQRNPARRLGRVVDFLERSPQHGRLRSRCWYHHSRAGYASFPITIGTKRVL